MNQEKNGGNLSQQPACGRNCKKCLQKLCTQGIPIFATLDYAQLARIAAMTLHKRYAKGEIICAQGHEAGYVAIFNEGSAKAVRTGTDGREQILYVFAQGDFFGEQQLFSPSPSPWTLVALEPVLLCTLTREAFAELLRENPDIGLNIINELGSRLSRMEQALHSMGARTAEARIATALLQFADKYGTPHPEGTLIRMPLSREGLAGYIGMARETVSRKLGQLETDGLLRSLSARQLLLTDLAGITALAETESPE